LADVPQLAFSAPPIWEIAISAGTATPGLFNTYDVREVHDLFRADFPNAEKQQPFTTPPIGPVPIPGAPPGALMMPQVPPIQFGFPDFTRWWFVSESGRDLIQAQENFIARNWRRLDPSDNSAYPGFDALFASFKVLIGQIDGYNSRVGRTMPPPGWCELLYDNLIPLDLDDGTTLRLSEALSPLNFERPRLRAGFLMTWWEGIGGSEEELPNLQVTANSVAMPLPDGGGLKSYVKLQFVARSSVAAWEEAIGFLSHAHDKLRSRLVELTTDRCRESWGPQ
jgi:uncharacterized protein (TIGR04255 family)